VLEGDLQDTAGEKQLAHELVERLAPSQLPAVVSLLQFMLMDPVSRAIAAAPLDDEVLTPEAERALDEARQSVGRGEEGKSHEDFRRELGQ
jgi:hypothetical protein